MGKKPENYKEYSNCTRRTYPSGRSSDSDASNKHVVSKLHDDIADAKGDSTSGRGRSLFRARRSIVFPTGMIPSAARLRNVGMREERKVTHEHCGGKSMRYDGGGFSPAKPPSRAIVFAIDWYDPEAQVSATSAAMAPERVDVLSSSRDNQVQSNASRRSRVFTGRPS
jgi:hypothetical protein